MKNNKIELKLIAPEVEALMLAYQTAVEMMENEAELETNDHDSLLLHHAIDMREKLEKLNDKDQQKYTIKLGATDALAMYQLWRRAFPLSTYNGNAVRKVYGQIDKQHKNITWIR